MASTRLPGKPLADIHGEPMIVHVWRRAMAAGVGPVLVAAGEAEIVEAVEAAGGMPLLTRPDHPSGSDRVWEAVESLRSPGRHDVIVNLQGDLPMLDPAALARCWSRWPIPPSISPPSRSRSATRRSATTPTW